jgi:hypothetical protein
MKAVEVELYSCFNPAVLDGVGQCHALATLPPGKRPGIHFTKGLDLRASLDSYGKSHPHWDITVFMYKNFLLQLCSIKEPYFKC